MINMNSNKEIIAGGSVVNSKRENVRIEDGRSIISSTDDDEEDDTCCRRATYCHPLLREIIVTNAIFTCMGLELRWADLFSAITSIGLVLMVWATMYFLLGPTMLPGGGAFGLFFLVTLSYVLGWSLTCIPHLNLPPVFGMLLAGLIIRNTDVYNIHDELGPGPTSKIRNICLTFIMLRTGLQLTTTALREHPFAVIFLAFLPSSVEMAVISCCSIYILGYPIDWAFLIGTVVACMSPVVTMNCMLSIAEEGYGEDKGIASLLYTASSIESVHVTLIFSICFSIVLTTDRSANEWWSHIPAGLREFTLFFVGIIIGMFLTFFPHRKHKHAEYFRMIGLIAGSLMCTTGASMMVTTGGGFLATFILSFVAITGWRILAASFDVCILHSTNYFVFLGAMSASPLKNAAAFLWHFIQPVLVGVIGADIDLRSWPIKRFGLYVICIFAGLTMRVLCVILSTHKTNFTPKERLFIAIAWLPKGTIQAALAPLAFEHARKEDDPRRMELAVDVLGISVTAILFLAPLGAFLITNTARSLLNQITDEQRQRVRKLSYMWIVGIHRVRSSKSIPNTSRNHDLRERKIANNDVIN